MAQKPYYRLYPWDFEMDEAVRGKDDAEFGFYIRCLNHAWMNDGIPANLEELERVIPGNRSQLEFEQLWEGVGHCFFPKPDDDSRLYSRRHYENHRTRRRPVAPVRLIPASV